MSFDEARRHLSFESVDDLGPVLLDTETTSTQKLGIAAGVCGGIILAIVAFREAGTWAASHDDATGAYIMVVRLFVVAPILLFLVTVLAPFAARFNERWVLFKDGFAQRQFFLCRSWRYKAVRSFGVTSVSSYSARAARSDAFHLRIELRDSTILIPHAGLPEIERFSILFREKADAAGAVVH
jgi:hypothetical protein